MNKKTIITKAEGKRSSLKKKVYDFLKKNNMKIICFAVMALMVYIQLTGYSVFADPGKSSGGGTTTASGADGLWNTISTLIQTWVTRLGGVVMFVGGVMFGLGWKSDDAEQKSRGVSTLIAGAIVVAVAQIAGQFFK